MDDDVLNYDDVPVYALGPSSPQAEGAILDDIEEDTSEAPIEQLSKTKNQKQTARVSTGNAEHENKKKRGRNDRNYSDKSSERQWDHHGLTVLEKPHPQELVLYRVDKKPKHRPTRTLFIGNLRRPLDAIGFQNHLRQVLRDIDSSYTIDRAWMNRTRTHSIVLVSHVEAAEALRGLLHGQLYPLEEERMELYNEYADRERSKNRKEARPLESIEQHRLFVDYMDKRDIGQWIFEEDLGPKNGKWRVEYRRQGEHGEVGAEHLLLEGDFRPIMKEKRERDRHDDYRNNSRESSKDHRTSRDTEDRQDRPNQKRARNNDGNRVQKQNYNRTESRRDQPTGYNRVIRDAPEKGS